MFERKMRICLYSLIIFSGFVTFVTDADLHATLARAGVIGGPPYRHGGGLTDSPVATLTCNVYGGENEMREMLAILDEKNVKATFFVGGSWAVGNKDLIRDAAASGHEIGNHGYWHRNHSKLSREDNIKEIGKTGEVIKSACGITPTLFAPPSGDFNPLTIEVASELGYTSTLWTHDTIDWRDQDVSTLISRATKNPSDGMFILTHPTKATVKALPDIIDKLESLGYRFLTVSESLGIK